MTTSDEVVAIFKSIDPLSVIGGSMVSKIKRDAEDLRKVPQKWTWFSWGYSARADVYHGVFIECGFFINFKNLPDYYV